MEEASMGMAVDPSQLVVPCGPAQMALLQSPYEHKEVSSKVKVKSKPRILDNPLVSRFFIEEKFRKAANAGELEAVTKFLDDGVNVNSADERKRTALHFASCKGNRAMVDLLISRGANVNLRDCNNNCPLHLAACTNHIDVITLLLRAGTDVNSRDGNGKTPLHYAQSRVNFLLRHGVGLSAADRKGAIFQVVELLQTYMTRMGDHSCDASLDELSRRVCGVSTDDDMDELGTLLQTLTSMTIERLPPAAGPGPDTI